MDAKEYLSNKLKELHEIKENEFFESLTKEERKRVIDDIVKLRIELDYVRKNIKSFRR